MNKTISFYHNPLNPPHQRPTTSKLPPRCTSSKLYMYLHHHSHPQTLVLGALDGVHFVLIECLSQHLGGDLVLTALEDEVLIALVRFVPFSVAVGVVMVGVMVVVVAVVAVVVGVAVAVVVVVVVGWWWLKQ